jgi:hypothetical protein
VNPWAKADWGRGVLNATVSTTSCDIMNRDVIQ